MATNDHIKAMLRAFVRRDDSAFATAAREIITEERQKGHGLLAQDLERIMSNGGTEASVISMSNDLPMDKERGLRLAHVERIDLGWERIVLGKSLNDTLHNIVEEFRKREVFKSYGISAKRKILFFGPPGCGKTITARVMAGVLGMPLLYARFDSIVSSYLGETAANLRRIFDFAQRGSWVVLFDEFDAIGKGRDNPFEHGELKRVVNTLLQLMDGFSGDSLLIACTNHQQLLDPAMWRRFDEICYFPYPIPEERQKMILRMLAGFKHQAVDVGKYVKRMTKMSGDDIERICIEAIKNAILDARDELTNSDLDVGFERQRNRMRLTSVDQKPMTKKLRKR